MLRIMVVLRNVEYQQFQGMYDSKQQGDINYGASSQAGFILNYFLSNSPFLLKPAGRLEQLMSPWNRRYK